MSIAHLVLAEPRKTFATLRITAAEDTWEPERNFGNAQPLITEYKIAQPLDFPKYNHHHKARKRKL